MKKEESLLGIYAMILGIFALATVIHSVGLVAALGALGLAIPAVLQKKKSKVCGKIGLILSCIVLGVWLIIFAFVLYLTI